MPGDIQNATPNGVMPYALCTAFSESREYVQLQTQYHDGAVLAVAAFAQTARHSFALSQRLTAALVVALKAFWDTQQGGPDRAVRLLQPDQRRATIPRAIPRRADTPSALGELVAEHRARPHGRSSVAVSRNRIIHVRHNRPHSSTSLVSSGLTFFRSSPTRTTASRRTNQVVVHRFGSLDAKQEQRFIAGIGPRKLAFRRQHLSLRDRNSLVAFWEGLQAPWQSFLRNVPNADQTFNPTTVTWEYAPL